VLPLAVLCLAAQGVHGAQVTLPASAFTLRWQHSIEKIEWAEDYLVAGTWLYLRRAHIRGSGAGMEPPAGAWFDNGVWHYRPDDPWRRELLLARSGFVPDYELCIGDDCRRLTHWLPLSAGPTTLKPCSTSSADPGPR
jgi:hypothetical protein